MLVLCIHAGDSCLVLQEYMFLCPQARGNSPQPELFIFEADPIALAHLFLGCRLILLCGLLGCSAMFILGRKSALAGA